MCRIYTLRFKKKLGALMMALVFLGMGNLALAQSSANYAFSTNTTASLALDLNGNAVNMSTGTTQLLGAGLDAAVSTSTNIGFDFFLMGNRFTQFALQEDGILQLGTSTPSANTYTITNGSTTSPQLAAFCADMRTGTTTGEIRYKLIGAAPNRTLVVEFKEMQLFYTSPGTAGTSTFQMRLYESTGIIQYVYGTMSASDVNTGNRAPSIGFYTGSATNAFASVTYATQTSSVTSPYTANPNIAAVGTINELTSTADGSRRLYSFTPPLPAAAPTSLTFTGISASAMTLNWTAASPATNVLKYVVYNSTNGTTYNYVNTVNIGTNTLAVTNLTPGTNYFWKVYTVSEGALSATSLNGTQATSNSATYYWVGTGGADFSTAASWNTNANGSGSPRTTADATDALIIDGDGTTAGTATTVSLSASASIGVFRITNNTAVTLQSSSTTTRTLTITGGSGDDFDITAGSSLTMNNANNAAAIVFTGTNNTGNIAGTLNLGGATGNKVTTTGGTGTVVTVQGTGIVNSTAASTTALLVGSTTTLTFAAGSNYNVSGYTTTDTYIPTATWNNTSNITLSGGTTGTGVTNNSPSLGNVTINSTTLTGNLGLFTSSTVTINGNFNIIASGTGNIRPVSTGLLTVLGNINLSGGTLQLANTGTVKLAGNFNQTGGTLDATATTNTLEFNGTAVQNATIGTMGTGAVNVRINNAAGVNLTGNLLINDGATLTISNGNITGSGTIAYGTTSGKLAYNGTVGAQTANAKEFPAASGPASLTINNTATAPNNVINVPFNRTLGTAGALALTAGILNNAGNTIAITNTATGGVTGGSATAYLKGIITRVLPASLATGSTYLFPVGKSGYNQMELVNPTTGAGGTVTVSAEAIDGATGGTPAGSIVSINANRYWAVSTTNGAANLTATNMRLYDAPGSANAIAGSATLTGGYGLIGSGSTVVTGTSITTGAPGLTAFLGYYVMGVKANPPSLSGLAITPTSTSLCVNATRNVTVTATPALAAITGVALNYSINGVAQTSIAMTNTSGSNWSGTIPTVTPTNANVTWSVTATDANNLTATQTGTAYKDEPFFGYSPIAVASASSVCSGTAVNMSVSLPGQTFSSSSLITGNTSDVTLFGNRWPSFKMQLLYTATELNAMGIFAGNISGISVNSLELGSGASNTNYIVKMGPSSLTALTDYVSTTTGFTTVFPSATYTHIVGVNTITFSTPYNWDGNSNIIIDFAYNGIDASTNATSTYTTTATNTVVAAHSGNAATPANTRPNITFIIPALTASSYSWSNGSTVVGTSSTLSVTPTVNTNYTATLVVNGCNLVSNTLPVTVNPVPTAPTGTGSAQCGAGIPTAFVASTAGVSGSGTFLWYDATTAGNLLQGPAYGALANYYTNDFTSSTLTNAAVSGTAAIASGSLALTTATTGQQGGFTINASGSTSNQYQVDFDLAATSTGTDIADGISYSFADDASAAATAPAAEHGSGSKLRVCFDSYDAVSGTNGKGIYVMYNAPTSGADAYSSSSTGVLGYVPDVSWIPTAAGTVTKHVTITVNAAGQLTVTLAGSPIVSNLQLPPAFINANKGSWKHVFSARNGGIAGGFALDNLVLKSSPVVPGYTTYQSSITNPTTFYVAELGTGVGGCESPRTPVAVTFSNNPLNATATPGGVNCLGGSTNLSVSQTGSTNNYTLTWSASPSGTSGLTPGQSGSLSSSVPVTPTAPGNYVYTITGVDGSCVSIDTVNVLVKDPFNGVSPMAIAAPSTLCAGSSTNLGVFLPTPIQVGNGSTLTGNTSDVTVFGNRWPSFRMQLLYTAAELNAAGIYAGFITSISVNSAELGSDPGNTNYTVKMGSSAATALTDYVATTGFTTVFPSATINHVVGLNTIQFSNPYNWDGTSNVIIDFGYNGIDASTNATSTYTTTATNTVVAAHSGNTATPYNTRPDLIFSASPAVTSYSWSNGSTVVGTSNAIVAAPTVNTNYTATLVVGGCSAVSNTVPVTINTIPALAPDGTSGSNSQPSGSSFLYTDGSCDLIAGVTTSGNSLGVVTASVAIDATVQTYNSAPYLQRHYTIVPTNNASASVTLYATQAEFNAYNTAAGVSALHLPTTGSNSDPNITNIRVAKYATALPSAGGVMLTPTLVNWNAAKSWWEITVNTPSFSSFFIYAGGTIPLEIKLLDFTGVNEGKRNRLDWSTAKESIGDKFTVQRSTDGRNFSSIGTVVATGKGIYNFYDENPVSGMNQYRLLLTDTKGNQDYSKTVTLTVRTSNEFAVEAYPNPAKDLVNVKVSGVQGTNAQLMLMDVSGRVIKQMKVAGNTATLDMHEVVDGIYLLKYVDDSHTETIKMNKQ